MPHTAQSPRLQHLASQDLDQARELVAALYSDHRLALARRSAQLDYSHHYARAGALSFGLISYGAGVRVDAFELQSRYLVQLPIAGHDRLALTRRRVMESSSTLATIHNPDEPFVMNWSVDCRKLVIGIDRGTLERAAEQMLGMPLRCPLVFTAGMDTVQGGGLAWKRTAAELMQDMRHDNSLLRFPLARQQFEIMLVNGLLAWQPNTMTEQLRRAPRTMQVLPRHVRHADDYLRGHLATPLTIESLAAQVQVSVRSLHHGFAKYLGTTPMRRLRELRMERVHADLLDPALPASVTETALRWGFAELGRFAAAYRRRYGESPSDTLRRRP